MQRKMMELRILQEKFYRKIKRRGFKDIEYGREHQPRLYEPVNISRIDPIATAYYDAVWEIYHQWVEEKRCRRDTLIAELLASQDGETGTLRGIARILRQKKMRRASKQYVQFTLNEINELIRARIKIIPAAQD